MPDDYQVHWKHLGDRAGLSLLKDGKPIIQLSLDAGELDDLIRTLGRLRAGLPEPVTTELDPNSRVEAVVMSGISIKTNDDGTHELVLRHPGLGWLSFAMNEATRKRLGRGLVDGPPQVD